MRVGLSLFLMTAGHASIAFAQSNDDLQLQTFGPEAVSTTGTTDQSGNGSTDRANSNLNDATGQTANTGQDNTLTTGAVEATQPVQSFGSINPRQSTIDDQANLVVDDEPFDQVPLRLGTFLLRSSVTEQIALEHERDGSAVTERTYSRTTIEGELQSDWSRHELTITGEQVIDKTISGDGAEDPSTSVGAELRLDLSSDTTANLTFDYEFGRENQSDANAINNATTQSDVHQFDASASLDHVVGSWRGRATISGGRSTFGDATLGNGTIITQSDRDEYDYTVTLRAGVDIGAAHLPFVEGDFGQIIYDDTLDTSGFARSSKTYGLRVGTSFDFGEKRNGEISIGYARRDIDDPRLTPLQAFTINGNATWSPRRGTQVTTNLLTTLEDSTTPGLSGSVFYQATSEITYQLRENVETSLDATLGWRRFSDGSGNQLIYGAGAGFIWWWNRYFGLDGDISYEKTTTQGSTDDDDFFVGLGVTLRP